MRIFSRFEIKGYDIFKLDIKLNKRMSWFEFRIFGIGVDIDRKHNIKGYKLSFYPVLMDFKHFKDIWKSRRAK